MLGIPVGPVFFGKLKIGLGHLPRIGLSELSRIGLVGTVRMAPVDSRGIGLVYF